MKKIVLPFLVAACLLFSACSSTEIKPKLTGITFRGEMAYYNESYGFEGEIAQDKTLRAKITAPKELSDLNFTVTPSGTTVEYKGITYTPAHGAMPFSEIMDRFYGSLLATLEEGLTANSDGLLETEYKGKKIKFFLSPTGLPQKAEIENSNFTVSFYNVSIKEDSDG